MGSKEHSQFLVVFYTQVRTSLKSGHPEEVTCGGNALKFYSAVRLRMIRTGLLKTEDKVNLLILLLTGILNKLLGHIQLLKIQIVFWKMENGK